jgi:energy-coupling factor transport system ATP-binding protein
MTVIPFLLSILRLGELLSLILIIRGVGRAGIKPTQAYRLSFHKADGVLLLSALGILLALLVVHKFF